MKNSNFTKKLNARTFLIALAIVGISASSVNAQTYHAGDVAVINAMIDNNNLPWIKDAPASWPNVDWSADLTNKRIIYLFGMLNLGITGDVDFSNLTEVKTIHIQTNSITSLNLTGLNKLENLTCSNNKLKTLDLSGNPALNALSCEGNKLETLNLSGCVNLQYFYCNDNNLTELDLSGTTLLYSDVRCNAFTSTSDITGGPTWDDSMKKYIYSPQSKYHNNDKLDLRAFLRQESATVGVTNGEKLGLSTTEMNDWNKNEDWINLLAGVVIWNSETPQRITGLNCDYSDLAGNLDMSDCQALEWLYCSGNQLTALDVSGLETLGMLYCSANQLTALDISGCVGLFDFACEENQLTTLDASGLEALKYLACGKNQLTTLAVNGCKALKQLYCSKNQLTALDANSCEALTILVCNENQLTALDVSGCEALKDLGCDKNQLTALDVSSCKALERLYCEENQLTALDVNGCEAFKELFCSGNQLTALDLSGLDLLTYFYGSDQTVALTLYKDGDDYSKTIPLNSPVFVEYGVFSYAGDKLISNNKTVNETGFTVETGISGYQLSGDMHFSYSEEGETAIITATADAAQIAGYYSIMGQRLTTEPANGIYIIMYSNGTAKKVVK